MTLEQLENIRRLLDQPPEPVSVPFLNTKERKAELQRLHREIKAGIENLHGRLKLFRGVMKHKKIGNRLNLGTKTEEINWEAIPPKVASYFRLEFGYQPEDISAFYISTDEDPYSGKLRITINLDRSDTWHSYVVAGTTIEKEHYTSNALILCNAAQTHPKEATEAMTKLNESLWQGPLGKVDDNDLSYTYYYLNSLRLTEAVLGSATQELERQLAPTPATT